MTEKIAAVEFVELGERIGALTDEQMAKVTDGMAQVLGIRF